MLSGLAGIVPSVAQAPKQDAKKGDKDDSTEKVSANTSS
jgi:hypothetical protein